MNKKLDEAIAELENLIKNESWVLSLEKGFGCINVRVKSRDDVKNVPQSINEVPVNIHVGKDLLLG